MSIIEAAPAKIKTRAADAVIMGAVEAYRDGGLIGLAEYRIWITEPEWRSIGRRLVAYGCPVLSKGLDKLTRLYHFAVDCTHGIHDERLAVRIKEIELGRSAVAWAKKMEEQHGAPQQHFLTSEPESGDDRPRNAFGVLAGFGDAKKAYYEAIDGENAYPAPIPPVSGGSPEVATVADEVGDAKFAESEALIAERVAIVSEIAPLARKAARPLWMTHPAIPAKSTPADHHVSPEALQEAGWDLRYFLSVQRSWAVSVDAIMRASELGRDAAIRAEVDEFHHFHDEDDRADFVVYLRIIGSPISAFEDRPIFAWDEFMAACVYGSPIVTRKPVPPMGDDERHSMERVLRETCECGSSPAPTPNAHIKGRSNPTARALPTNAPAPNAGSSSSSSLRPTTTSPTTADPARMTVDGIVIDFEPHATETNYGTERIETQGHARPEFTGHVGFERRGPEGGPVGLRQDRHAGERAWRGQAVVSQRDEIAGRSQDVRQVRDGGPGVVPEGGPSPEFLIDPDETLLEIPLDPCEDAPPLSDYDDYPNADQYYSPWMRPAYEPMTLDDYDAMRALGLVF